jgi:two-component system chemotaxis response regulator CheY/two-component system response regulator (stage 0 sporulation protein A)
MPKITAIIVDDDVDTVEIFSDLLEIKGITVIGKGYDGAQAIQLFENLSPDIIFLDVMMENVDGITALEQIRRMSPDTIVIMVTADLRKETEEKLKQYNASAIIHKPFDINAVLNTVEKLLKQKQREVLSM